MASSDSSYVVFPVRDVYRQLFPLLSRNPQLFEEALKVAFFGGWVVSLYVIYIRDLYIYIYYMAYGVYKYFMAYIYIYTYWVYPKKKDLWAVS